MNAMQVYAWARMVVTYSGESGLAKGLQDTFSGEKPCKYCKAIQAERTDRDESPDAVNSSHPIRVVLLATADADSVLPIHREKTYIRQWTFSKPSISGDAPPVPPPRVA